VVSEVSCAGRPVGRPAGDRTARSARVLL